MTDSTTRSLAVIATGVVTSAVLWGLFRLSGVGLDLTDSASMSNVGIADVLVATTIAGFAAWGVHSFMLRRGLARWWPLIGSAALSISIIWPSRLAEGSSVLPLVAMHLIVGWELIAGLGWFARSEDERACAWDHLPFRHHAHAHQHDTP